jgi:hypothetical protein
MNRKRLASILASAVTAGLVLSAMAKLYVQFGASTKPDPASGRTEPVLFAPRISHSWDYATSGQVWLLIGLTSTVLVCFVAWAILTWLDRNKAPDSEGR